MMCAARRGIVVGVVLIAAISVLGGCGQMHPVASNGGGGSGGGEAPAGGGVIGEVSVIERPDDSRHPEVQRDIRLVVRDFLHPGIPTGRYWGYYAYLLITDRTANLDDNARRRAAASAFMCQFQDVSEAMKFDIPNEYLAILYAPIRDASDAAKLRRSVSGDDLLAAYDYTSAKLLARAIGRADIRIALVANPSPIPLQGDVSGAALNVIDLSQLTPDAIRRVLVKFRAALTRPVAFRKVPVEVGRQADGRPRYETMFVPDISRIRPDPTSFVRRVMASLGRLVDTVIPAAEAAETSPQCL